MRWITLALLICLTLGCESSGISWGPGTYPKSSDLPEEGDTSKLTYIKSPGDGAQGVDLVPTVKWDNKLLKSHLGGCTSVELSVTTREGSVVYRIRSTDAKTGTSWLLDANSLRIFSHPTGTKLEADPQFVKSGRLSSKTTYLLSLKAENADKKTKVFEQVRFETAEVTEKQ